MKRYQTQLTIFFEQSSTDMRLGPAHISLYFALTQEWHRCNFQSPFHVRGRLLMKQSKIRAKATYHRVMRDLHRSGYIRYVPTYDPVRASSIFILPLGGE